eukprot:TRINITY_DN6895_c0_g1_i1.p1 TRINITY_DN6895_c0_g1~~TRINITY_DN6895_c0_g1_i1.p1  ORF type:complete len:280 (-),score=96.88 TRINITY_DN6895_c0_g1_i1:66-905(-)
MPEIAGSLSASSDGGDKAAAAIAAAIVAGNTAGRSGAAEAATALRLTTDAAMRADRERLRKAAEIDAKIRGAIEKHRRAFAELRVELEERVSRAEAEMEKHKETALEIQKEGRGFAAAASVSGGAVRVGAAAEGRQVDEVATAVREADASVAEVRQRTGVLREEMRTELEVNKCLSGLYDGMTGIRWDHATDGSSGFVALNSVKRFEVSGLGHFEASERLWDMIEASLKPGSMIGGARGQQQQQQQQQQQHQQRHHQQQQPELKQQQQVQHHQHQLKKV